MCVFSGLHNRFVCSDHGTCFNGVNGNGTCTCDTSSGYTGVGCAQCAAANGWYGLPGYPTFQSCERCPYSAALPGSSGAVCNGANAGECLQDPEGEWACECKGNYTGANCTSCDMGYGGTECQLMCHDKCNGNGECETFIPVPGGEDEYVNCVCEVGYDASSR